MNINWEMASSVFVFVFAAASALLLVVGLFILLTIPIVFYMDKKFKML